MPDRRRRTAFRLPLPERAPMMLRERQSSSPGSSASGSSSSGPTGASGASGSSEPSESSGSSDPSKSAGSAGPSEPSGDDNPFAAPPENRPDQPWQPRHPARSGDEGDDRPGESGDRPAWGSQWSNQQPGRQNGGFGSRPGGGPGGQGGGKGGPDGGSGGTRWDPTDPAQRRARYAVLGGMWAFFFALFDFPEIALLLGALSVYWSISALRSAPKSSSPAATRATADDVAGVNRPADTGDTSGAAPADKTGPATGRTGYGRPQTTAAVSGLVTALLALSIVATTFTMQLVYRDYYTCVNDALTKSGALACNDLLPEPLEPFFGVKK